MGDLGSVPSWEDPLEEGMATHSGILAWRIPQTEEPGGLQSKRNLKKKIHISLMGNVRHINIE